MAQLDVMGDYRGPGERKTAETLAAQLPPSWFVIANRALPTEDGDDLDLVIIGERGIYLLEEKAWGPRITLGHHTWRVGASERPNPLNRVRHLGRVLAGTLARFVPDYRAAVGRAHLVKARVVLSHASVTTEAAPDFDTSSVLKLSVAAQSLIDRDTRMPDGLQPVRDGVLHFLRALAERAAAPDTIGPYQVVQEVEPLGRARVFLATNSNTIVFLRCYPEDGWGPQTNVRDLIEREHVALSRLSETGRAWQPQAMLHDDTRRWFVVPVIPPAGTNLHLSIKQNEPARTAGRLPASLELDVVRDAYTALAEVHEEGLLHRGLHPRRIWLGKQLRVRFSDFVLAKLTGQGTISNLASGEGDLGQSFRAPECRAHISFATEASDVYALALAVAVWLLNDDDEDPDHDEIRDRLVALGRVGEVLQGGLAREPGARPAPREIASALGEARRKLTRTAVTAPPAPTFAAGARLADRYRIDQLLGEGGFARTWLAYDELHAARRVIKQFTTTDGIDWARKEFDSLSSINHDRCARVWDIQQQPAPGYLVLSYTEGEPLDGQWTVGAPTAEDMRTVALTALEALAYLHSRGTLHRDVTPPNVIVGPTREATLIDFGLATPRDTRLDAGTVAYMAPETIDNGVATERSDLYGLAVSLLRVMLGRWPYAGDPLSGTDERDKLLPPTRAEAELWGPVGKAMMMALYSSIESQPYLRPATARALADQLRAVEDIPVVAGKRKHNPTVEALRRLYRGSTTGNAGNRGLDDQFARDTYVPTLLDTRLMPEILDGRLRLVLLTGNPGDGKTSFLVSLGQTLKDRGASGEEDAAGWRLELEGHTFVAVYDASESHGELSSDELLHEALSPQRGEDPARRTVLLAVNDGRLLQFFGEEGDLYQDWADEIENQMAGRPRRDASVALVDLKRRTLAVPETGSSLTSRILDSFTATDRWSVCETCLSRDVCPMRSNAVVLRGEPREAVDELVLTSHLRRRRRATFRDVRSALGWIITGDRSCEQVHQDREQGRSPLLAPNAQVSDLAFSADSADYLVQEWAEVDPGEVGAPTVQRIARMDTIFVADPATFTGLHATDAQRRLFFRLWSAADAVPQQVRAYRYFEECRQALLGSDEQVASPFVERILLGLSRILGAPGYTGTALAVSDSFQSGGRWAVLKEFSSTEFTVARVLVRSEYLETTADALEIRHQGGAKLVLTLDTLELLLRSADGELLGDAGALSVRREIEGFAADLRRQPSKAVRVVDPTGRGVRALVSDGTISRADA